ncbi:IS1106 transposase [Neisseria meningitidis]|nr:IS1106 transposase [Neisseria meningitidis]
MRKACRNRPLSEVQTKRNRYLSKTRYVVEQSFGTLHRKFRYARAAYFGLLKVSAQSHLKAMCLNLLKAANRLRGIRGGLRGYLGKIRRYLGLKQPKTCVWVSAVGRERNFAKVSDRQCGKKHPNWL